MLADGCGVLSCTISQEAHILPGCFFFFFSCCGFSERVLKDNPIFSPTAPTPPAHPLSGAERRFEYSKLSTPGFGSLIPRYPMAETPGTPDQPDEMPG